MKYNNYRNYFSRHYTAATRAIAAVTLKDPSFKFTDHELKMIHNFDDDTQEIYNFICNSELFLELLTPEVNPITHEDLLKEAEEFYDEVDEYVDQALTICSNMANWNPDNTVEDAQLQIDRLFFEGFYEDELYNELVEWSFRAGYTMSSGDLETYVEDYNFDLIQRMKDYVYETWMDCAPRNRQNMLDRLNFISDEVLKPIAKENGLAGTFEEVYYC